MAKGFFKKLALFSTIVGAAAVGGIAIYNKYKASTEDFDDDFLDFDDDDDDDDDFASANDSSEEEDSSVKVNVNIDSDNFVDEEEKEEDDDANDDVEEIKDED